MKTIAWLGLMILLFTPAPIVYAQNLSGSTIQTGIQQVPGTSTTDSVKRTKEVGPQGQVIEKEEKTTSSKRDHASYKYSGLPCKWTGGVANTGSNAALVKDTGPRVRYTVDRLPIGANPQEALWVKMRDGTMMMVDPKLVQNLP
ncbi:MAG: hypothetical protein Q7O12_04940 [Deltaproteobacteria bacterium]|nr:hypothetical protein [Deltaproteobacteria bacterium]